MNFDRFTGPGSIAPRRAFWDKVFASVMSARKTEGKNASVTEYEGQGTLVAFKRDRGAAPTTECPPCVQVTFSGVSFDCGCITVPAANSTIVTDTGGFNDIPLVLPPDSACDPLPSGQCQFDNFDLPTFAGSCDQLSLHQQLWLSLGCSGSPDVESDRNNCYFSPYVVNIGGTWYVVVFINSALIFYGSGTIGSAISNEVVCSDTADAWDDPTFCATIESHNYRGIAHGGTATIESVACPEFSPAP